MSKLSEVFDTIISQLHWGPSHRPFLEAVIAEHDALEKRVFELEEIIKAAIKESMDISIRNSDIPQETKSIGDSSPSMLGAFDPLVTEPIPEPQPEDAPAAPVDAVTIPAEPVQTPITDLLAAQPEPVSAGPTSAE